MEEAALSAGRMRETTAGKAKLFNDCKSLRERYDRERQLHGAGSERSSVVVLCD